MTSKITIVGLVAFTFLVGSLTSSTAFAQGEGDLDILIGNTGGDVVQSPDDNVAVEPKAIPDWVNNNFIWYGQGLIEQSELINAIKFLIENEILILDSNRMAENVLIESGENTSSDASGEFWFEGLKPGIAHFGGNGDVILVGGFSELEPNFEFANKTVENILANGGTNSAWDDGIASFSKQGMRESVIPELGGIVVLCNNAIDKQTQQIDSELKIIEQWLEIISEKQVDSSDEPARLADGSTTESAKDMTGLINISSELDFITEKLTSIDQRIVALETGLKVLEEKHTSAIGEDAQLANIDLQNSLQKQQQTLQTMSNVSKMLHDTAKVIIQNIRA